MKRILLILTCIFSQLVFLYAQKRDTMTNDKVIKLASLGLESSVIISKIQTSYTTFDVSTDALIELSDRGVSSDVIKEMMRIDAEGQISLANEKGMNDPATMRTPGIYYYDHRDSGNLIQRVDPTIVSSVQSGGFGSRLAQAYTGGIANEKLKSSLAGATSRLQIDDRKPTFFFYFENSSNPDWNNWLFATATSPNEFVLVKLDVKRDSREAVIGTANYYGSKSGISDKMKIDYTYEQIGEGIYKIVFADLLEEGEYCFLYASSTPSRFDNDKVFDFGIH